MRRASVPLAVALIATLSAVGSPPARAATVPGFAEQTVLSALTQPTDMAFAPDGRVFVSEKSGIVKVFPSITTDTPTVVADIRTEVFNANDRGLLSLALDPQFPTRPYLYLAYTFDAPIGGTAPTWGTAGQSSDSCPNPPGLNTLGCVVSSRLSRITLAGNAMVGQEQVLINNWCQQFGSHSIGQIRFGPDGALYLGGGDGASFTFADYGQVGQPVNACGDPPAGVGGTETIPTSEGGSLRSQDLRTSGDPTGLDGSIIRVDPDTGNPLPDNPLAATGPDANARRIVAYGLRNPYRMTFEPGTNTLYVGDVGANTWDEVDKIPTPISSATDFGWPCIEGPVQLDPFSSTNLCQGLYSDPTPAAAPAFSYKHGVPVNANDTCTYTGGSATSGLAFSTGTSYPSQYTNALFMADYARNCIWVVFRNSGGQLDWSTLRTFTDTPSYPVDLEIGPDGLLYYVAVSGSIRRFTFSSPKPTAVVSADVTSGEAPIAIHFDATHSTDAETPNQLTYNWDLNGDGVFGDGAGPTVAHIYTVDGVYNVTVRVTDPTGLSSTASVRITIGNSPPKPVITAPGIGATYKTGDLISFRGRGTDLEDGVEPVANLSWEAVINHCPTVGHCHQHVIGLWNGTDHGSFNAPEHDYPSSIDVYLTATDTKGVSTTVRRHLSPLTTTLTVETNPAPLAFDLNTDRYNGRVTTTVIQGSAVSVGAPSPQPSTGGSARFTRWSDGGAQFHNVVVHAKPVTVIANYSTAGIPLISAYDATAPEGNVGTPTITFSVRLSRVATKPISVVVQTASGTATAGGDFRMIAPERVTFRPGQTSKRVVVHIRPDFAYENNETFSLILSSPANALIARPRATATIRNDDPRHPRNGYWLVARDGGIFTYGDAHYYGSAGAIALRQPIVAMTATPTGHGYWLVAADGGIFTYGDAHYYGSAGAIALRQPIVAMTATPTGHGYWLVAADGGIFTYGDAHYYGSAGAIALRQPIVAMTATPTGHGYWLVAADGGIFTYGDAHYYGSAGAIALRQPIVAMTATPTGHGYWLVAADGGIFTYGDAHYYGSAGAIPNKADIVAITSTRAGNGYRLVAADGAVYSFGAALRIGPVQHLLLGAPVVGAAAT